MLKELIQSINIREVKRPTKSMPKDILRVKKENNLQTRLLYPARISFRYEGEFRSFTDKQKLREFSTTKPALQQMLKDLL